ncbi:MAG: hypothetical protein ACPL6F_01230, partial [Anaerolineales bacterium]
MDDLNLRIGIQQRVLPDYRKAFFEVLGQLATRGLAVFGGQPLPQEGIKPFSELNHAQLFLGKNRYLFDPSHALFLCWQQGLSHWLNCWQPQALIVEANPRILSNRQAIAQIQRQGGIVLGWGLGAPPINGSYAFFRRHQRLRYLSQLDGIIAYSQKGAKEYLDLG